MQSLLFMPVLALAHYALVAEEGIKGFLDTILHTSITTEQGYLWKKITKIMLIKVNHYFCLIKL